VLEGAGHIARGRDAQRRPCRLRPEALEQVTAWAEHTRRAWEERFERLDEYLRELQGRENDGTKATKKEKDDGRRKKR
jgi:hypothetical protein